MERRTVPALHSGVLVGQPVTAALIGDVGDHPKLGVARDGADARAIGPATTWQAVAGAPPEKGAPIGRAASSRTCGRRLTPAENLESLARRSPTT